VRQVAEVAEGNERVATLLDGALDQDAKMTSVAVKVAEDEQTAHAADASSIFGRPVVLLRPPDRVRGNGVSRLKEEATWRSG
jgi:hypothetical protein